MSICTREDWKRQQGRDDYFFLDPDSDIREGRVWWDNLRPWFQDQGYTLYAKEYINREIDWYRQTPCSVFSGTPSFPYAYIGGGLIGRCYDELGCGLSVPSIHPRLVFAQDSQSRHVCIKVLRPNSDEHKIIDFLHQQSKSWNKENFPCVVPVLDVLSDGNFWFAVFPRWEGGTDELVPWFNTMGEVLDFIQCVLKVCDGIYRNSTFDEDRNVQGLCFLHDNRIFHRDIHTGNFLTNHFGCAFEPHMLNNLLRPQLRSTRQLTYCHTDFDLSLMLPADTDIRLCQLPISESYPGVDDKPYGVIHGELYFNPFAYDVGCLGIALSYTFQHLCPSLPILVPLLSGMLTSNINERFTALEALAFFDENRPKFSECENLKPPERTSAPSWEVYERWPSVPTDLSIGWVKYKGERPSYFMQQVVGPLCQRLWGLNLVYFVRRLLRPLRFLNPILYTLSNP